MAREAGYAVADQLMEIAVRSIAVPVRNAAGTWSPAST
jgi:DNA-binding IclR family transcriptional regulator